MIFPTGDGTGLILHPFVSVAFTPDSAVVVCGSRTRQVRVWDYPDYGFVAQQPNVLLGCFVLSVIPSISRLDSERSVFFVLATVSLALSFP